MGKTKFSGSIIKEIRPFIRKIQKKFGHFPEKWVGGVPVRGNRGETVN